MISRYCASNLPPKYIGYLYTLRHPLTGEIFYVGQTGDRRNRYCTHISSSRRHYRTEKEKYICDLLKDGLKPVMGHIEQHEIRSRFDEYFYNFSEFYYINKYSEYGWNLLNIRTNELAAKERSCRRIIEDAEKGEGLDPSDFYYKNDEKGFPIYNLRQINKLGYNFSKEQFASHWAYIIDISKYEHTRETTLDYIYSDISCNENYNGSDLYF